MDQHNSRRSHIFIPIILIAVVFFLIYLSLQNTSASARDAAARYSSTTTWRPLLVDSFELNPGQARTVEDANGEIIGEDGWMSTTYTASNGLRSLWATGGGSAGQQLQAGLDPYPSDGAAVMISGPIRIGNAKSLIFSLDVWLDTEPGTDYLEIGVSGDGAQFSQLEIMSGRDSKWESYTIDLEEYSGLEEIWISITFFSDGSVNGRGAFIDNLKLLAEFEDMPILIPVIRRDSDPTPTPVPEPGWLDHLNRYRLAASLLPLAANNDWSFGGELHSRYMVKNDYVGHFEDQNNPWYTPEGAAAAQSSNVFVTSWVDAPDETAIDYWMAAPFHAVSMLDPQLKTTGLGTYREMTGLWHMAGTLDVKRGLGELPQRTTFPIMFPPPGGEAWSDRYPGGEFPNPLASCPGYPTPSGPPIILQLGSGELTPEVTAHSFESEGQILESCMFDETSYVNSNGGQQTSGRNVLNIRDAVVLMPRAPLAAGKSYTVTVVANGQTITWSFSTGTDLFGPISPESIQQQTK